MRGEKINMDKLEGKLLGIYEAYKLNLVMGVLQLKQDLIALGRLIKYQVPPQRQWRVQRQAVAYLIGDASGSGFGSVLWWQGKTIS